MSSDSTPTSPEPSAGGDRLLIIEMGRGLYGIDSTTVREIVNALDAARLPGAPPHVRGIVRGPIIG